MKIASFNVNGVNGILDLVLDWLRQSKPDVACLQELKAPSAKFPEAAFEKVGYGAVWQGQSSWNGVAILARNRQPVETRRALPGDADDKEARYIEAAVNGVLIACLYVPNGNPIPGPKFRYKQRWLERLKSHADGLLASGAPVAMVGDYNIMPTDLDVYAPDRWRDDALFRPEVRQAYADLLTQGWTDAVRHLSGDERIYTFWKYWRNWFERDAGLRIDHCLLSANLMPRLTSCGVDRDIRAQEGASDHAPVWIELTD